MQVIDGGLQFSINFCKLNAKTKKYCYPLPRKQEATEHLVGTGYLYCLGLKAGVWQIAIDKALKWYTASTVGNIGFFEHKYMPFGLCNAPAPFQRLMKNCLSKLSMTYCLIYLDDVIFILKTDKEHLHLLHIVFHCSREHHLKLKLTKCEFFKSEINYLAHHISKEGIWPNKENLKAVVEFTPSQNYTEIWNFLDLVGHYRWFKRVCSHCAIPAWSSFWERSQQKEWASDAHEKCIKWFWDSQENVPTGPCVGFHWFQ